VGKRTVQISEKEGHILKIITGDQDIYASMILIVKKRLGNGYGLGYLSDWSLQHLNGSMGSIKDAKILTQMSE
jgi:hypothetical protein